MEDAPAAKKRCLATNGAPAIDALPAGYSVCLGVSGSVAAVKTPDIVARLLENNVSVDVVLTEAAHSLLQASYRGAVPWTRLQDLAAANPPRGTPDSSATAASAAKPCVRVWRDSDEWTGYATVGVDAVVHIELAKRNSLLLIAPLCANSLAAAALGTCGNLLSSVLRAWYYDLSADFAEPLALKYGAHTVNRPIVVAPAMNTFMWHQRVTASHLATLRERGVHVVSPISKLLACGDVGIGAMAEVEEVVAPALQLLRKYADADADARARGLPAFRP